MGEKRGTKALEVWCKRVTEGYPGVKVENMTTSWRDGLAFCAIIHHFRPDLIDFHSLDKRDVLHNNELAFRIAERHLGIPALLDAEDMVEYEVPDRLSMLTYLSQFYQTFVQRSPGNSPTSRTPIKRSSLSPEPASLSPASQSPPTKVSARGDAQGRMLRRDPCNKCGQPVFLAERLTVSSARLLYHRTCFRCARCNSQLTLANYYETEEGRFCCETCPDEEKTYPGDRDDQGVERAPLATGDESPSFSEQSRPSSVAVDTNDLPSKDACDLVNNVDSVQSSETEDYAKDQSLSLVQMRRKLFENVTPKDRNSQVFDSGQLKVVYDVKQSEPAEEPKTYEDKLMESELTLEDETAEELKCKDGVIDVKIEAGNESLVDSLKNDVPEAKKDEPSVSAVKEDEPLVPKAKEEDPLVPKPTEDEATVPKPTEDETTVPKPTEDETTVPKPTEPVLLKSKEDELLVSGENEKVISGAAEEDKVMEDDSLVANQLASNAENFEQIVSKARENESLVSNGKEGAQSISDVREVSESGPYTLEETENDPSERKAEHAHTIIREDVSSSHCKIKVENEVEPSKDEPQMKPDVMSQSKAEDDVKQSVSKMEDYSESVNELSVSDKEVHLEMKAKDNEKDVKSHLPPRPPPPTVKASSEAARKPPVTPRKSTSRDKPTVSRVPSYPSELNPFSDDSDEDDSKDVSKNEASNPFDSDDAEEEVMLRRKEVTPSPSKPSQRPATHHEGSFRKEDLTPRVTTIVDKRRRIPVSPNLNPFWEDGEEPEDDEDDFKPASPKPPVPKPRSVLTVAPGASASQSTSPFANRSTLMRSSGKFGSANSLSSVVSSASTMRRKKHAAPPPPVSSANSTLSPRSTSFSPSSTMSVPSSPTLSSGRSTLGRSRKSRPAPPPPSISPVTPNRSTWNPSTHYSPLTSDSPSILTSTPNPKLEDDWQEGKLNKDEVNRNRQNQLPVHIAGDVAEDLGDDSSFHSGDKSSHGKWKRKKGPAPPRPIPQRRQIRAIPLKELKRELDDIEVLQLELERQGVNLERTIRRKFDENPDASESSMNPDIEDLVLQLFELVNEKNELFRKQAELMYLRRQQRLEEEHADLEYQIRVLMEQPERNKTDSDKAKEEKLIQRLVEVVERRNEIVECLEMDRLREAEEDHSIHSRLELFASKSLAMNDAYINDLYKSAPALTCCALKEKKKKRDKTKKGTLRLHTKNKHVDADKDIDETEMEQIVKEKKTKRKWF